MAIEAWIFSYVMSLVFWTWVIRYGGAQFFEGTLKSEFFIAASARHWDAAGIRFWGTIVLTGKSIWFVIGVFKPAYRFYH